MKYGKIIKGNVIIEAGCTDDFSAVEEITGYVDVRQNATLQADSLSSIGGNVDVGENATLNINKKYKKNDAKAKNTRKLALEFNFNCFLKAGFLFVDGILAKIISKRKNVYKIQICGKTKISYCIEVDGIYSHGDTIKQAKESLIYKISNRDTSQYKDLKLDSVVTYADAIKMYRCITGACEAGTKHFCETVLKKKAKKYTIKEIIELTKGQYGSDTFSRFFLTQGELTNV